MELNGLAVFVQHRRHLRDFAAQRLDVGHALRMIQRDDGGAAAKPAERFAKRNVEINRQIARRAVVLFDLGGKLLPRHSVGELGRGRIACVTRSGHVVFAHQIQIYVQCFHLKPFTVSIKAAIFSSFAPGVKPWPRLKMCPGRPRMVSRIFFVSVATMFGVDSASNTGERFPCNAMCDGIIWRRSASEVCQSMPRTFAPLAMRSGQLPCVPSEKAMTGGAPSPISARCVGLPELAETVLGVPIAVMIDRKS